jgi:hypothetical protein
MGWSLNPGMFAQFVEAVDWGVVCHTESMHFTGVTPSVV